MSKKIKAIPKFESEAQERAFWESGDNDTTEFFDSAKSVKAVFPNLRLSTKAISLRLPEGMLDRIKIQAAKMDVPYQSLMKVWLSERLDEIDRHAPVSK